MQILNIILYKLSYYHIILKLKLNKDHKSKEFLCI